MPDFAGALGASKAASTLLVLFIPSRDRNNRAIDQEHWVDQALSVLGTLFGGATAFPQGKGVWRDDAQGGTLLFDKEESDMVRNIEQIADGLGAQVVGHVPDTGGGAFGAARLAGIVESLQSRLVPGQGKRASRPSDASWVHHPKVPMSEATGRRLSLLAERASASGRKVSPMQIAAQILEDAVAGIPES
jgi:hypothetical protein